MKTLAGFGGQGVTANALLSDGRLVAGDDLGTIRVGSLDNWAGATVISNGGSGLTGVLAGRDGSFVTTDKAGKIRLWRNGTCEVQLTETRMSIRFYGVPLAVVGRRLVVGKFGALLVTK